jgi:hypothetical protein
MLAFSTFEGPLQCNNVRYPSDMLRTRPVIEGQELPCSG